MKINLDDNGLHLRFAPLTLSRPVGNLRMGIYTNDERWERLLPDCEVGFITESYLQEKFPAVDSPFMHWKKDVRFTGMDCLSQKTELAPPKLNSKDWRQ